ncbi:hypothetical protein ACFQJC_07400 [Haloferax namakaokahaiae]|uniref:CHAT domain-containing protein n=1 Tax=Haloferax namakaokahaiae TaxID=1748331 RepID=A0ABD5ZED1_9EURY
MDEVVFEPVLEESAIVVRDTVNSRQSTFHFEHLIEPQQSDAVGFPFPAMAKCSLSTAAVTIPNSVAVVVRTGDREMLGQVSHQSSDSFPADEYYVELNTAVKSYLHFTSAFDVQSTEEQVQISFQAEVPVELASRAHVNQPTATIQTTEDPAHLAEAITALSAGQLDSPERSYPAHRPHPPAIELSDRLDLSAVDSRPNDELTIEVPETPKGVFAAAPLAYYLKSNIEFDSDPAFVVGDRRYDLGAQYEETLADILKQVFYCDCLVRTEGLYQVELDGLENVRDHFSVGFDTLYEMDTATQLRHYLAVDIDQLRPRFPQWLLTAYVSSNPKTIEAIPHLLDELAIIRTEPFVEIPKQTLESQALDLFLRTPFRSPLTRSGDGEQWPESERFVRIEKDDSKHHTSVSDDICLNANEFIRQGYLNRENRPLSDQPITVVVVHNDAKMIAEAKQVRTVYGTHKQFEFELQTYEAVSREQLAEILQSDIDFLHYIGHATHEGIECTDGYLDVETLDDVAIETFFLNACQSYTQGRHLVEKGAVGGVVTLSNINSHSATDVGAMLAKLLNQGFTIRSGLEIARSMSITGGQYSTVGDAGVELVQAESGTPYLVELEETSDGWRTTVETYPTKTFGMGSLFSLQIGPSGRYYLTSDTHGPFDLSAEKLANFLSLEQAPVRVDNILRWSSEIEL